MIPEFFAEQPLSFEQVKVLAQGLLALAKVDGLHDNEMALIREFYQSCARAGDPRLEELAKGAFDPQSAKKLFGTPELSKLFVKSLMLLAFADGTYARAEDALIREWAQVLGLTGAEVDRLHQATKEYLLASLSHVQNLDALKEVSRRLNIP